MLAEAYMDLDAPKCTLWRIVMSGKYLSNRRYDLHSARRLSSPCEFVLRYRPWRKFNFDTADQEKNVGVLECSLLRTNEDC